MKRFEVIPLSASETSYRNEIPSHEYYGVLPGLVCGWQFEFQNKKGEINYNSVSYHCGTPEELAYEFGESAAFEIERWNGWEPTGRVVFRGYATEWYCQAEREWYVNEATEEEIRMGREAARARPVRAWCVECEEREEYEGYEYEEYEEYERMFA